MQDCRMCYITSSKYNTLLCSALCAQVYFYVLVLAQSAWSIISSAPNEYRFILPFCPLGPGTLLAMADRWDNELWSPPSQPRHKTLTPASPQPDLHWPLGNSLHLKSKDEAASCILHAECGGGSCHLQISNMHIADPHYKWRIERNEVKMGKLFSFDFDDGKYALRRSRAQSSKFITSAKSNKSATFSASPPPTWSVQRRK